MTSDNRDHQLISFTRKFISLLQDFYAERLAMFYVLHANWVYKLAFGIVKPFLAKKTKDKVIGFLLTVIRLRLWGNCQS